MSDQDVEQITKKMKSIGLSVPTAVYEEIVKRAAGGSIGGWCRQAVEEALKPKPVLVAQEPTPETTKAIQDAANKGLQVLNAKGEVVDAIVEKPLKYQYGTKVEPRPGIGGLG